MVSSDTSESAPPMTPAMATGSVASQMASIPFCQPPVLTVQGPDGLPFPGRPDHDGRSTELGQVEGVEGLAQLQEDIVGGVHHVVDGPGSGGPNPGRQPGG